MSTFPLLKTAITTSPGARAHGSWEQRPEHEGLPDEKTSPGRPSSPRSQVRWRCSLSSGLQRHMLLFPGPLGVVPVRVRLPTGWQAVGLIFKATVSNQPAAWSTFEQGAEPYEELGVGYRVLPPNSSRPLSRPPSGGPRVQGATQWELIENGLVRSPVLWGGSVQGRNGRFTSQEHGVMCTQSSVGVWVRVQLKRVLL